jgi:hypothetical protein
MTVSFWHHVVLQHRLSPVWLVSNKEFPDFRFFLKSETNRLRKLSYMNTDQAHAKVISSPADKV